jgi:hypothetical protein
LAALNKSAAEYCKTFGIETLYHITMMVNIPSILINGLLSHNKVKEQKVWVFSRSNQEIQGIRAQKPIRDLTANDYVPLFFSKKTPMLCAIETAENSISVPMVYISIKPEIIGEKGVYFSDGNIASKSTKEYCQLEELAKLDWGNIRGWNPDNIGFDEAKRIKSAEVLVPHMISPKWFKKLIVPDEETKAKLSNLPYNLPIEVNSEFYFTDRAKIHQQDTNQ